MSTCQSWTCDEQHGLVDGVCRLCRLANTIADLEVIDRSRVMRRVQNRVNGGRPLPRDGSTPHHDRVLAVVLVVPGRCGLAEDDIRVITPGSPHWDAFWQDIGRPPEGQEGTPKDSDSGERVQPACPTTMRWDDKAGQWFAETAYSIHIEPDAGCEPAPWPNEGVGRPVTPRYASNVARTMAEDEEPRCKYDPKCDGESRFCDPPGKPGLIQPWEGCEYVYRWRGWHDARVLREIADRCNAFWTARAKPEPYRYLSRGEALRFGCECKWHSESIVGFALDCPVLLYHRGAPNVPDPKAKHAEAVERVSPQPEPWEGA